MKYNELVKQLNDEKNKNKDLLEQIKKLNNKIKLYEQNSNEYINKIKDLEKLINIKNNELNALNSKLNYDNSISYINPGEKIIAINFESLNQEIRKPVACKNTDIISKLEEKLYNEYPKYKDYNTYLTVNGNLIKRFKTLEENGIKNGNSIIVNIYDE